MSAAPTEAHLNANKGIIAWFARNPVAANLLMVAIIIGGLHAALNIRKQMFPQAESTTIRVTAVYRGASPQEVEETITTKLEDSFQSIEGLERIITRSNRGSASATLKVLDGYDPQNVLDDVKSAVDAISSFPSGMEPPRVVYDKYRQEVMWVSIAGDVGFDQLKRIGETIQDEIRALPDVNMTDFYSGASYEIAIEVDQDKLREYNLSFTDIATAVRNFSTNRSAGEIRADSGNISVRVEEQAYIGAEFENVPLRILPDGTYLRVGDVANVSDGFEEGINYSKMDGMNALTIFIGASSDQSITDVASSVRTYLAERQKTLPSGIQLKTWVDLTYYLNGRLYMMLENMFWGGLLVFAILALFLRMKLAFWVMLGLPVSFLGALAFLPFSWINVTVNVASLFAFIMVLGVVVDDAIIIGESISTETQDKGQTLDNVIRGAQRVAVPATFGVLTTMAAFAPMVLESGPQSAFPHSIGYVVILCLLFSLVESKLILPAHLAGMKPEKTGSLNPLTRFRTRVDNGLSRFINGSYLPFLQNAIYHRYTVLMVFISAIILTVAMFASGLVRVIPFPKIPHDFSTIQLEMDPNAPDSALLKAITQFEAMIKSVDDEIEAEFGKRMVDAIHSSNEGRSNASVQAKLVDPDDRPFDTFELSRRWREKMPEIPDAKNITIQDNVFGGGSNDGDLSFRLKSRNIDELRAAASAVKAHLKTVKGVSDINDSEQSAAREIRFKLKPVAYSLGLTTNEVAAQASYGLYGIEAQRIMRDRQEIRVMVRYPKADRDSLSSINDVMIRTPGGTDVPLSEVADIEYADGVNQIYREDGNRAITVWASVDFKQAASLKIADEMKQEVFPEIKRKYSSVFIEESGKLKDDREGMVSRLVSILVILLPIYVLLALPLKSYLQPLMIMSVIPFGIIGAIWGHIIVGLDLSQMSLFGMFAVVGVVVNDSLVMVDYVNRARERGETLLDAVLHAGQKRFRAILLTSLTTFIGLVPIMSETSLQAQIVIPMAVSLAFGVLFATAVTLILVPMLYMISNDLSLLIRKMLGKGPSKQYQVKPATD
ncbi:efflux RND transporter permease subunit [Teredinibacter turnerae]|uniref:efflux RND transporter permease subunit n=1 Tax=Teredinibacter turnerae TaxID=2426 RepID=UPI00036DB923|nr:efflux RND transporter permease subunit [Teredinibacter turnerae]